MIASTSDDMMSKFLLQRSLVDLNAKRGLRHVQGMLNCVRKSDDKVKDRICLCGRKSRSHHERVKERGSFFHANAKQGGKEKVKEKENREKRGSTFKNEHYCL